MQTLSETLTVTASSPLVNTQTAEIAATIESRRVLELPVNSRDFSRLALFSPAAKVSSGVATLAFNGTDIAQNNFLLDGTDATHVDNAFMSNGRERGARLQTASSESIQEFRVLSTNYSAEYGRAAGAVVTAITKSGGNMFTGGTYLYVRDDALDARNFLRPARTARIQDEAVRRQPRRSDYEGPRVLLRQLRRVAQEARFGSDRHGAERGVPCHGRASAPGAARHGAAPRVAYRES